PDVQRDGGGEDRDRDEEVQRHHARVEVGQHHDPAEQGLGDDAGGLDGGEPDQVTPPVAAGAEPPRGDEYHQGDQRDGDGDQPVAELDPGVDHRVRRRGRGDQAAARALRPVRAPQARLAEPDRGTGRDDPGGADHPGEGEDAHRGGGGGQDRPGPGPRGRAGPRARAGGGRGLLRRAGPEGMGVGGRVGAQYGGGGGGAGGGGGQGRLVGDGPMARGWGGGGRDQQRVGRRGEGPAAGGAAG